TCALPIFADFEGDVYGEGLVGLEDGVVFDVGGEAGGGGRDGVSGGGEGGENVVAGAVACRGVDPAGVGAHGGDLGVGDGGASGVGDGSGDASESLGEGGAREGEGEADDCDGGRSQRGVGHGFSKQWGSGLLSALGVCGA